MGSPRLVVITFWTPVHIYRSVGFGFPQLVRAEHNREGEGGNLLAHNGTTPSIYETN